MGQEASSGFPDGIGEDSLRATAFHRHASPLAIVVLGIFLTLALAGLFGGQPHAITRASAPQADLTVAAPEVIRNGEFFEMRIEATPHRHFDNLTISVSPSLWRDITVNSTIPQAGSETVKDGEFRFSYGAREAGDPLTVKIDFQINPSLFAGTDGEIALLDGEQRIISQRLSMKVMP